MNQLRVPKRWGCSSCRSWLDRRQHLPPEDGVHARLIPPAVGLQPLQNISVQTRSNDSFDGAIEMPAYTLSLRPFCVRQNRDIASVDLALRPLRERLQIGALCF